MSTDLSSPITFSCGCGKTFRVDARLAGKKSRCKACGRVVQIPAAVRQAEEALDDLEEVGAYDVGGDDEAAIAAGRRTPLADSPQPDDGFTHRDLVGAHDTYASNPGRTRVQWGKYFASFPQGLVVWLCALAVAGVALALGLPWYFPAGVVVVATFVFRSEMQEARHKFIGGCINPGIVVSKNPYLVAVHTHLGTSGHDTYEAIKILAQPLGRMTGGPPEVGARLATAAHYAGPPGSTHWTDFYPQVVNCVTTNDADIRRTLGSIARRDWQKLEQGLNRLRVKRPGLYTLWKADADGAPKRTTPSNPPLSTMIVVPIIIGMLVPVFVGRKDDKKSMAGETSGSSAPTESSAPTAGTKAPAPSPTPPAAAMPPGAQAASTGTGVPRGNTAGHGAGDSIAANRAEAERRRVEARARRAEARGKAVGQGGGAGEQGEGRAADAPTGAAAQVADAGAATDAQAGEAVEVLWGGTWYKSRVVRREGEKVLIHYEGYSDNFDEWVTPDRVRQPQ